MSIRSKIILTVLCLTALLLSFPTMAEESGHQVDPSVAVLFTNDIHSNYDQDIGYDGLMLLKKELGQQYAHVILVDAGDAVQGAPIGSISEGHEPIRIMNEVGYDIATLGNHEFDYGFDVLEALKEELNCGYICANFCTSDGEVVYEPYRIIECDGKKIAFIGVDTPDTFSRSVIHEMTDDLGVPMYDFKAEETGESLYSCLQGYIDEVHEKGADFVILVGHLGNSADSTDAFNSPAVISNLRGLDAVIDGHSHQKYNTTTPDADGQAIPLAQTGSYFQNVGVMILGSDGSVNIDLLSEIPAPEAWMNIEAQQITRGDQPRWVDADTHRFLESIAEAYAPVMNRRIGEIAYDMSIKNGDEEVSRMHANGLCELIADAYREIAGTDICIINAGSVRNGLPAGEITFNTVLNVLPYSNDIVIARLSGQTVLDALEFGCRNMPVKSGGFPQVSGMEFTVDTTAESSVQSDENENFVGVSGTRRVLDVLIDGKPLNPERMYTIATTSFLIGGGDGYKMFADHAEVIGTTQKVDNILLADYIEKNLSGTIPPSYRQGTRIHEIQQ